jgi:MFS family permease
MAAGRGGIRTSYAALAAVAYVLYGVGAVGPYLRIQLRLSDAEVGLHSSALAVGLVVAGWITGSLHRRFGEVAVRAGAIGTLVVSVGVLAAAPSIAATLAAAVLIGLGTGTILGYANATLASAGGKLARVRVARANVWSMVAAFAGPVALAAGASAGPGWWIGLLPAFGLLAIVGVDLRSGPRLEAVEASTKAGRLPSGYWFAWAFLAVAIAAEFSIVFWGATLVQRRTEVATAEATLIGALFLAGMFAGRLALSMGIGTGHDVRRPLAVGLALAGIGASLAWLSTAPLLSGVGLFLAGLGIATLYPIGVAAAIAAAPGQLAVAGTRLTLASGLAILVAPLALGTVADLAGVVIGWSLVLGLVAVALAIVTALRPPASRGGARESGRAANEPRSVE